MEGHKFWEKVCTGERDMDTYWIYNEEEGTLDRRDRPYFRSYGSDVKDDENKGFIQV